MNAFNNSERWNDLKNQIISNPVLIDLVKNIYILKHNEFYRNKNEKLPVRNIENQIEVIGAGRSREVIRLGKGLMYPIIVDGKKITLVSKLGWVYSELSTATYSDESDFETTSCFHESISLSLLCKEGEYFKQYAKDGKNIPGVTGIVAGYGVVGILTQDLSHGGKYAVEREVAMNRLKLSSNNESIEVFHDLKYANGLRRFSYEYLLKTLSERLQIDKVK